jgi:hypothetical protein
MIDVLRATLICKTNHRGLILASERKLATQLQCAPQAIRTAVFQLAAAEDIEILSPLPFLVAKARSWSGEPAQLRAEAPRISGRNPAMRLQVPVGSSFAAAATHTEVGGAGEGGALLEDVLALLGPEADPAEFADIVRHYSPDLVRRCLRRVEATPRIRVSRAALFRALLTRLSH